MKNKTFYISIAVILALFFVCIFVSCGLKNKSTGQNSDITTAMSKPFDAKGTIKIGGTTLQADINRTTPGKMTVAISEPKALSGMKFAYDGKNIEVSYNNLSVTLDSDSTLASSAGRVLLNSINAAAEKTGVKIETKDSYLSISGKSDSGSYEIKLDKNNNSILSVNVPEANFECRFDDFLFQDSK